MALINCPECDKRVSDQNESCPHCGYPINKLTNSVHQDSNLQESQEKKNDKQKNRKKLLLVAFGSLLLVLIGFLVFSKLYGLTDEEQMAINEVNTKILSIGEVTSSSNEIITEAEIALEKLDEKLVKHVKEHNLLKESRNKYNQIMADHVINQINNIGEINLNSFAIIQKAQDAYDKLDDSQKELVENYSNLQLSHSKLEELQVSNVIELIEKVGTVSIDSKLSIDRARDAYNGISDELKKRILNYEVLEDSEKSYKNLLIENAIKAISLIGEVTLDSEKVISDANKAFFEVAPEDRESITNKQLFLDAKEKFDELVRAEKLAAKERELKEAIQVTGVWYSMGYFGRSVDLYFNFVNHSQKTIKYLDFGVIFYNGVGDVIRPNFSREDIQWCQDTGPYGPGEGLSGTGWSWYFSGLSTVASVELVSLTITYDDSTKLKITNKNELEMIQY